MKRLFLSLALALGCIAGPAVVTPSAAPTARAGIAVGTIVIYGGHGYVWSGSQWLLIW